MQVVRRSVGCVVVLLKKRLCEALLQVAIWVVNVSNSVN
jgi:hypothetical protein